MGCEYKKSSVKCACTYLNCSRHGKCCECIAYHNAKNEFPGCLFSKEGEKEWNRSFDALVKDRKNNSNNR